MIKIVWTKKAYKNFNEVVDYVEAEWGKMAALIFVEKSFDVIELVSNYPGIGLIEKPEKYIRGFQMTRHNRIFYRVSNDRLFILDFCNTRHNVKKKEY